MNALEHYTALAKIYQSTNPDTIDVINALNQLRESSKFYSQLASELNGSIDLLAELSQVRSEVGKVARLLIVGQYVNNILIYPVEKHLLSANVTTIASSLESWFCVHSILKKKDSNKLFLQIANVYQNLIMAFIENASFDHVHSILETALNQDWQLLQNLFMSSAAINICSSLDPEHAELYDRVQKRYKHKKNKTTKEEVLQQEKQKPEQKSTTNHQTSKPQIEQEQSAATTKLAVKALTRSLDVWKRIKPPNKKNMSTMAPNTKSSDIYLYHVDVATLLKDVLSDDGLSLLCDDIGPSVAAKIVGSGSHLSRAFDTLLHITSVSKYKSEGASIANGAL